MSTVGARIEAASERAQIDGAQVIKGLNVGDKVILHPSEDIADGSRVAPR